MASTSAMSAYLVEQSEKCLGSPEGLTDARATLTSPSLYLNLLLDNEINFHRQVILKIINRIGQELPEEFQAEGRFKAFYAAAIKNLLGSSDLAIFSPEEVSTGTEFSLEQAEEMVKSMLSLQDERIRSEMAGEEVSEVGPGKEEETSCLVLASHSAEEVKKQLNGLGHACPTTTLFLKGVKLIVKGRVFDGFSVDVRLRSVLPQVAVKGSYVK